MKRDKNQTVEYKESWHDKYLEWICGYANAKPRFDSNTFFFAILPNLTYGLTREQLVAAVDPNSQPLIVATPNSQPLTVEAPNSQSLTVALAKNKCRRTGVDKGLIRILMALDVERGSSDLLVLLGLKNRTDLYTRFLLPALQQGLIEYTIPQKPNSRLQKYRLTGKGKSALASAKKGDQK